MAETPSVKKYYDYAQEQVDEQAILDKYNAATIAQFNAQREANRQNENAFYNQMYNTQKTAMDTIRQSNAAAVASGASRGVQAANELSALLGLQEESVASATELAQVNRQTAAEETAAVLENVLNAYQQATQERQQLVQQGIESASVDATERQAAATEKQAAATEKQAQNDRDEYLLNLRANDLDAYYTEIAKDNNASDFVNMTEAQLATNTQMANNAISEIIQRLKLTPWDYSALGSFEGKAKLAQINTPLKNLYVAYGLNADQVDTMLTTVAEAVGKTIATEGGDAYAAAQKFAQYAQEQFDSAYRLKYNSAKQ